MLVVGAGKTGIETVKFLLKRGARVSVSDSSPVEKIAEQAAESAEDRNEQNRHGLSPIRTKKLLQRVSLSRSYQPADAGGYGELHRPYLRSVLRPKVSRMRFRVKRRRCDLFPHGNHFRRRSSYQPMSICLFLAKRREGR